MHKILFKDLKSLTHWQCGINHLKYLLQLMLPAAVLFAYYWQFLDQAPYTMVCPLINIGSLYSLHIKVINLRSYAWIHGRGHAFSTIYYMILFVYRLYIDTNYFLIYIWYDLMSLVVYGWLFLMHVISMMWVLTLWCRMCVMLCFLWCTYDH